MAQDSLIYTLENVFQGIASDLIDIYVDLYGYETDIYIAKEDIHDTVYGIRSGVGKGWSYLERKQMLLGHPNGFSWTGFSKSDIGKYDYLEAYVRHDEELNQGAAITLNRQDDLAVSFRIEYAEQIGSTIKIIKKYRLSFLDNAVKTGV